MSLQRTVPAGALAKCSKMAILTPKYIVPEFLKPPPLDHQFKRRAPVSITSLNDEVHGFARHVSGPRGRCTRCVDDGYPAARAVRMAAAIRERAAELSRVWRKRGHELGFGVGIALGHATLGKIGFEGRFDYGAIGTVANLASRLCDDARAGRILITQRVYAMVEDFVEAESVGDLSLKGFLKTRARIQHFGVEGTSCLIRPVSSDSSLF